EIDRETLGERVQAPGVLTSDRIPVEVHLDSGALLLVESSDRFEEEMRAFEDVEVAPVGDAKRSLRIPPRRRSRRDRGDVVGDDRQDSDLFRRDGEHAADEVAMNGGRRHDGAGESDLLAEVASKESDFPADLGLPLPLEVMGARRTVGDGERELAEL